MSVDISKRAVHIDSDQRGLSLGTLSPCAAVDELHGGNSFSDGFLTGAVIAFLGCEVVGMCADLVLIGASCENCNVVYYYRVL